MEHVQSGRNSDPAEHGYSKAKSVPQIFRSGKGGDLRDPALSLFENLHARITCIHALWKSIHIFPRGMELRHDRDDHAKRRC
jgi:hypothetical protein